MKLNKLIILNRTGLQLITNELQLIISETKSLAKFVAFKRVQNKFILFRFVYLVILVSEIIALVGKTKYLQKPTSQNDAVKRGKDGESVVI